MFHYRGKYLFLKKKVLVSQTTKNFIVLEKESFMESRTIIVVINNMKSLIVKETFCISI